MKTKNILIITLCLLGITITANAQLILHSNGHLSFRLPGAYGGYYSPVSLEYGGNVLDSMYYVSYNGGHNGLYFYAEDAYSVGGRSYGGFFRCQGSSADLNIGLRGTAFSSSLSSTSGNPAVIGVWGDCNSYQQGRFCYGVLGTAYGTYNNAAVCGIATGTSLTSVYPDDKYAGLFFGKTKVSGNLTVTGSINATLLTASPSADSNEGLVRTVENGSIAAQLQGLSMLAYRNDEAQTNLSQKSSFPEPERETLEELEKLGIDPANGNEAEEDAIARQIQEKEHYALSADELEKVFPNLVYTDKEGGKQINYVEMVPLLVQCINELNVRLSAIDGNSATSRESRLSNSADITSTIGADTRVSPINAVLYQNSPNPFTAQTEIRFSLPDNAPASYIYIFDMTGKMQKQIPVDPGQQSVTINGYELSAGIYLYSLVVGGNEIDTKRMILSK